MGLSSQAFWDMTLPEFSLASRGYRAAQQMADYRAGTIAALFANLHRDEKRTPDPFQPADFFASLPRLQPSAEEDEEPASDEEIEAFLTKLQIATAHEKRNPGNGNHA